jgi:hypothetical protein
MLSSSGCRFRRVSSSDSISRIGAATSFLPSPQLVAKSRSSHYLIRARSRSSIRSTVLARSGSREAKTAGGAAASGGRAGVAGKLDSACILAITARRERRCTVAIEMPFGTGRGAGAGLSGAGQPPQTCRQRPSRGRDRRCSQALPGRRVVEGSGPAVALVGLGRGLLQELGQLRLQVHGLAVGELQAGGEPLRRAPVEHAVDRQRRGV